MSKLILIGGTGFIGNRLEYFLNDFDKDILSFGSKQINLLNPSCNSLLKKYILDGDSVIFLSSKSPTKTNEDFIDNIMMANTLANFLKDVQLEKFILISSDAVYGDRTGIYDEDSLLAPTTKHGIMHLARENICGNINSKFFTVIRPTNVIGVEDPHNSYGPNRFIKSVIANKEIVLFGEGNSKRDYIYIDDVCQIIKKCAYTDESIILNAVSGDSNSFLEVARILENKLNFEIKIKKQGQELIETYIKYNNIKLVKFMNSQKIMNLTKSLDIYLNKLNF